MLLWSWDVLVKLQSKYRCGQKGQFILEVWKMSSHKRSPWARVAQGWLALAGSLHQEARPQQRVWARLEMPGKCWHTCTFSKCPKVHQSAECCGIAVARGGEATPGSHCWRLSSSVCWLCCPRAGAWGCLLTSKALQELVDHLQGRVISEKELTHVLA